MDKLWAPWRYEYLKTTVSGKTEGCILCNAVSQNKDNENLIVYRSKKSFIMLNRYPYNTGHLMIIPYNHLSDIGMLSDEEMLEMMKLISFSIEVLKDNFFPAGYNVGLNLGKAAGAGIDEHIHIHIVPRWEGDVNFMPVLNDTRVVSQSLEECRKMLKNGFDNVKI